MNVLAILRIDEARKSADLDGAVTKMKRKGVWVEDGWTREEMVRTIDPRFIHHSEHFHRLLHGGVSDRGRPFPGGGGIKWGGLVVSEEEALLRVNGSLEYNKPQEIYQQTVRFSNFHAVARNPDLTWTEKAQVLLTRDHLRVHCECQAYRFYHQRPATVKGFALIPEDRHAPHNNPDGRGGVCKHLNVTLRWLGAQGSQLASEMKTYYERPRT